MPSILSPSLAAALGLGLLSVGQTARAEESTIALQASQIQALGLRTQPVDGDTVRATLRFPATLLVPSAQQRVVASPLPSLVESLRVSVGDAVRAGQVLAVLRSAQAQDLQHELHVARSQAVLADAQLRRDEQLHGEGLIATARLETSRTQAALAAEHRDERALALAQAGGAAEGEPGRITLTAPMSGVVLERPAVVGQRVEPATVLVRLASLSPLWLEMQVPASQAVDIHPGDPVRVAGAAAAGKVIAIGHSVDSASQTVLVRAELQQPPPGLRVGQAVEALIDRSVPGLTRVPSVALVDEGGHTVVFVDAGRGRYRAVPVQAVASADGLSSVRGLAKGSQVVVTGTAALKSLRAAQRP